MWLRWIPFIAAGQNIIERLERLEEKVRQVGELESEIKTLKEKIAKMSYRTASEIQHMNIAAAFTSRRPPAPEMLASNIYDRIQWKEGTPNPCPSYSFPINTTVNPPYTVCIRYVPNVVDSFVLLDGHWGQCGRIQAMMWSIMMIATNTVGYTNPPVVVDVGANIGMCTLLLAASGDAQMKYAGENGQSDLFNLLNGEMTDIMKDIKIVAVEPDEIHVEMLRASVEINRFENRVTIIQSALSDSEEPIYFRRYQVNSAANQIVSDISVPPPERSDMVIFKPDYVTTRPMRLESVIEPLMQGFPEVTLMKIDVEGFELKVLRGATELLKQGTVSTIIFEFSTALLLQANTQPIDVLRFLNETGFFLACFEGCEDILTDPKNIIIRPEDFDSFTSLAIETDISVDLAAFHSSWVANEGVITSQIKNAFETNIMFLGSV